MKLWIIPLVGIVIIGALELIALLKGVNGGVLALSFSAIAAITTGGAMKVWSKIKNGHKSNHHSPDN